VVRAASAKRKGEGGGRAAEMDGVVLADSKKGRAPALGEIRKKSSSRFMSDADAGMSAVAGPAKDAYDEDDAKGAVHPFSPSDAFDTELTAQAEVRQRPLPRRNIALHQMGQLHARHRKAPLYDAAKAYASSRTLPPQGEVTLLTVDDGTVKAKDKSCLARLRFVCFDYRIPRTEWKSAHVLFFLVYLAVSIACLFLSEDKDLGRGWGSLAIFNSMILIIPATRNSILTWFLGLPFDHVVVYHRFFGRFTLLCAFVHFCYYAEDFGRYASQNLYLTGFLAMLCGVLIGLTSVNYLRRNFFNTFFYSHYAFIGYYLFAWLHVSSARPFLAVGLALYLLDKLLRILMTGWSHRCVEFNVKSKGIVQVRFPKSCFSQVFGMHKVGQYYFVNFPELSHLEWHPFSVSSGPREDAVELHIRDLGDHTHEIVALAEKRAKTDIPTYIRSDGPYGLHDFNFRRYPVVMLVGGGVGITPVIGMLKDVYNVGSYGNIEKHHVIRHAIETVYAVWVMRYEEDYLCFEKELMECMRKAQTSEAYPDLVVWVYVSRAKTADMRPPLIKGRPKFERMFQEVTREHPDGSGLVFACGPGAMVNQLWDNCIQLTIKGHRFDFHHETFEF